MGRLLQEIPTGQGNRVRAEVVGLAEHVCPTSEDLNAFFEQCFDNRITSSTKLNDTSSRSHALFTINVRRVVVTVGDGVDRHLKAMVRSVLPRPVSLAHRCCSAALVHVVRTHAGAHGGHREQAAPG